MEMNTQLIKELQNIQGVKIVAVSKRRTKEQIDEAYRHGLNTFGENRVQEFLEKYDPKYSWHIIGHLQTNKVKYIIGKVDLIESLDSIKLAKEIEKQAAKQGLIQKALVQIKISEDPNKTGLPYQDALPFIKELQSLKHIQVKGLMCVATHTEDMELVKEEFMKMNQLFQELKSKDPQIDTLSMGMSHDYKLAIECGSTMVRIGTALFE